MRGEGGEVGNNKGVERGEGKSVRGWKVGRTGQKAAREKERSESREKK